MNSYRNTNEYCIESQIQNKFRDWHSFDIMLKRTIIGADLAYYAANVKKIKESYDYNDLKNTVVKCFDTLLSSNGDKKPEEFILLYIDFLEHHIKRPAIRSKTKKDPDNERAKADAEEEAIAKDRKEKLYIECESYFEFNSLKENLFKLLPNVILSTCERQAFEEVTNINTDEERLTLSNFTPKGIVHLANRASYKMYIERLMNAQDYEIGFFNDSDDSCYPDIDYKNQNW